MQTPYFQRKWTIRRVFFSMVMNGCALHLSTNKDLFHSVHKPVKWTSLFARGGHGITICSLVPGMLSVPLALL